jgi:hypothetical protein
MLPEKWWRNISYMKKWFARQLMLSTGAMTAQSVWCWAMGWMIGVLGFDSWRGLGIFLFTTVSWMALGPTQLPLQWVPGALSLGVKCLGHEAVRSPPSSVEVKEWVELYLHSPNTHSWHGALLKHRVNAFYSCSSHTVVIMNFLLKVWMFIWGCIQNFLGWVSNKMYAYNSKHLLRSNTKGYGSKTH